MTLSDGSSSIAHRLLLDEAGIADRFERLLSVEQAGMWNACTRAYAYALQRCRFDPMDAMLVAVHPWDTDGAQGAGLASAWINRGGGSLPAVFRAPTIEASSMTQLVEACGSEASEAGHWLSDGESTLQWVRRGFAWPGLYRSCHKLPPPTLSAQGSPQ